VFTRTLHQSIFWARSIQSISPHQLSLRTILMLSSHLRLGLPTGLFAPGFPTKILDASVYLKIITFSVALPAHSGPRPLIQFRNHFSQSVGLLGRVISTS
jgi:hypothetical protein